MSKRTLRQHFGLSIFLTAIGCLAIVQQFAAGKVGGLGWIDFGFKVIIVGAGVQLILRRIEINEGVFTFFGVIQGKKRLTLRAEAIDDIRANPRSGNLEIHAGNTVHVLRVGDGLRKELLAVFKAMRAPEVEEAPTTPPPSS